LESAQKQPNFKLYTANADNPELLHELSHEVDEVYHLAAAVGVSLVNDQPIDSMQRNIEPTRRLLEVVGERHRAGQSLKFFLASSSEVYGRNPKPVWNENDDLVFGPTTKSRWSYGMSKAIDEFLTLGWAKAVGLPVVIGRFFNVVGPRQTGTYGMVLPRFISAAVANEPLIVHGTGTQTRCFAHVSDVISAIVGLMRSPQLPFTLYNIGSDQPISIIDLANRVIERTKSQSKIQFCDYANVFDSDFEDVAHRVPDISRLRQHLAWQLQFSLDEIIDEVAASQKNYSPVH
jgi:UDP-glucose 4-epimerase